MSWAVFASLGRVWGVVWARLGASESDKEASWGYLGASWEDLGVVLGNLGGFLRPFQEHFCKICCNIELYAKISKNLGKPMVFH